MSDGLVILSGSDEDGNPVELIAPTGTMPRVPHTHRGWPVPTVPVSGYHPVMNLRCNVCGDTVTWTGPLRHGPEAFVCNDCETKLLEARFYLS